VSLIKIDCEGCEWAALLGARRTLRKTPMLKIELVQPSYSDGNNTASPADVVKFLHEHGFELFKDHWLENYLYFGKEANKVLDIDKIFGNSKLNVPVDVKFLEECATKILSDPISPQSFDAHKFQHTYTDIIAIDSMLVRRMRMRFLGISAVSSGSVSESSALEEGGSFPGEGIDALLNESVKVL
jgi:hypothetical protein